jgi:two-component system, OmpR family, sensor histidine kinase TctE
MKNQKSFSMRRQLLGWIMIPIVTLCVVSAVGSYFIAVQITTQAYDAALMESARELANRLGVSFGAVSIDLPPAALAVFKEDNIDKFYYAVMDRSGRIIAGDEVFIEAIKHNRFTKARFQNRRVLKSPVRTAHLVAGVAGAPFEKVDVYVAETVLKRQALVNQILFAVVVPQLVLIVLAALAVWLGISRGLASLDSVRDAIASRSQFNLLPVFEVDAPVEIRPLVDAIDDLLKRLHEDIEAQRRFVANAAHQLRTPLAGLKTQTELAMRQKNLADLQHILNQVHRSADNVTRVVNQLLSLAKLEPTNSQSNNFANVDLNTVVKEATSDLVPYALNQNIDLGLEESNRKAIVRGDADSIREMVANLIDNAIRYTQSDGKVTVKVIVNGDVELLVEDDGPGIPAAERDKVFERFYRVLGNRVSGSGLGLAIVKEIAQVHHAQVSLYPRGEGSGTVAAVRFPSALNANTIL